MVAGINTFGIGLHLTGSVLIVFGQTVVKVAHCINESTTTPTWFLPPTTVHARWRRPDGRLKPQFAGSKMYAAVGWSLFGIGNILRFVSMRFAAQTVLSGLQSIQFIIIPFTSRFLLGVKPRLYTAIGVAAVLYGNILIVGYGPAEVPFTLQQLKTQWTTPPMKTFLFVTTLALATLHVLWVYLRAKGKKWVADRLEQYYANNNLELGRLVHDNNNNSGIDDALDHHHALSTTTTTSNTTTTRILEATDIDNELIGLRPMSPTKRSASTSSSLLSLTKGNGHNNNSGAAAAAAHIAFIEPHPFYVFTGALLYSAVASIIGAWSVLFSKSLTYVFSEAPASLLDWYSWLAMLTFVATAAFWVKKSNNGLRLYPASLIMPLMQAFWMCMSVIQGALYFDEVKGMGAGAFSALSMGLVSALGGALLMGLAGYQAEVPDGIASVLSPPSPVIQIGK